MAWASSKLINPATGKPFATVQPDHRMIQLRTQIMQHLKARYDAAQTNHKNAEHWKWADNLSPSAANSLDVRMKLRERSRYETANNGYLKGITLTKANDFTGSGPTLQITDPRFNDKQRAVIELGHAKYCKKIKQRRKLWQLYTDKVVSGEGFKVQMRNPYLDFPIMYDYRIFECDQFSSLFPPIMYKRDATPEIDGIRFSRITGEPVSYFLLDEHPGETEIYNNGFDGRWIPARQVIHWFRKDRQWLRGIPETSATLSLWALLRRYTLAVVQNAEIAADFTVLLKSLQPAAINPFELGNDGQPTASDPNDWFNSFPIDTGLMTVLPDMYDLTQLDPKQPVNMYDTFVFALVQEAARPLLVPRNLALGNSGGYNMASGTLDKQTYKEAIANERRDCEEIVLEPCFKDYWYEAIRIPNYFSAEYFATVSPMPDLYTVIRENPNLFREPPEHRFRWDEVPEHSDPLKVAQALDVLYKSRIISDTDIQEQRFNRSTDEHYRNLEKQDAWHAAHKSPEMRLAEKQAAKSNGKPASGKNRIKGKLNGNGKH